MLATERRELTLVAWEWPELDGVAPLDLAIDPWRPGAARLEFLDRFARLAASGAGGLELTEGAGHERAARPGSRRHFGLIPPPLAPEPYCRPALARSGCASK